MSLPRPVSLLLLLAVPGAAGWFGGKWAHEGLLPTPRLPVRLAPQAASAREPRVEPASPEGTWMARVRIAAPGDFAALLDELDTTFPKSVNYEAREAAQKWLLALWIVRDPDPAAEYVAAKKDDALTKPFGLLLGTIAPAKVAAILNGPMREALGKNFPDAVLRALADTDPREFLKLDSKSIGDDFTSHYTKAMKNLAAADPAAAAAAWLQRGTKAPGGRDALYVLAGTWLTRDPQAARRWVDALTDPEARRLGQHAWLGALAKQDVQAARRALAGMELGDWLPGRPGGMDEPALQYPQDARMIVLAALARENFAAAAAELENMERQSAPPDAKLLRKAIADAAADALPNEPAKLFPLLNSLANGNGQPLDPILSAEIRREILERKMNDWNAAASLEVLRLLESSPGSAGNRPDPRDSLLSQHLIRKAVYDDPAGAVTFIAALPEAERGRMAQLAIGSLDGKNPQLLMQTAAMVPPELWSGSMGRLLAEWPQEGSGILASLPDNANAGAARTAFARTWAKQDPAAVAQWIAALPASDRASHAARGLTEGWAAYDDTAASAWAAALPPGEARDGAALGLASTVAATEPEAAWQWAASISDSTLSADAFWNVARLWGREAPPEFRAAFSAALDRGGYAGDIKTGALRDLDRPRHIMPLPPAP